MARLTLTTPGEDVDVGGTVTVIGTRTGGEVITITRGSISLDASFNAGGDTVVLPGESGTYTVRLSGSLAIIASSSVSVSIPLGIAGISIQFDDSTLVAVVDVASGEARLGQLTITSTPQVIPQSFFGTSVVLETEPNDTIGTANPVDAELVTVNPFDDPNLTDPGAPSVELRGQIDDNNDVDVFAIFFEAGQTITLDVDGNYDPDVVSGLNSVISILDSAGNVLAENDDGEFTDVGTASPFDSFLTFQVTTAGIYYIAIESFENGTAGGSPENYHLLVSVENPQQQALGGVKDSAVVSMEESMQSSLGLMTFA